jgi:ketosteroid isomerase-like protein
VVLEDASMSSDAAEVVRRYFAAWPARDRAGAEAVVAADFHFTSPLDNRLDREIFFARCWPNSETMRSLDLKRVVSEGATVFVTYELTDKDGHRLRNNEVLAVSDNQVIEVEVYFGWPLPHRAPLGGYLEGEEI